MDWDVLVILFLYLLTLVLRTFANLSEATRRTILQYKESLSARLLSPCLVHPASPPIQCDATENHRVL
jgi:hypothetical protein